MRALRILACLQVVVRFAAVPLVALLLAVLALGRAALVAAGKL
jgi:hypothetical protein